MSMSHPWFQRYRRFSKQGAHHSILKKALLLSNVIEADHQNSYLFTNKGHFSSTLWVLSGVLAQFHE